jgi:hypothetical protein
VSSVAFVFAFAGWGVLMWPAFTAGLFEQVYALVACGAVGALGAWGVSGFVGKVTAADALVDRLIAEESAYRELTTIADVVGVMKPEVDR